MDVMIDGLTDFWTRQLLDVSVRHFYVFILIAIRLSGLVAVAPIFSQSIIPANARVLIVLTLSFAIAPAIQQGIGSDMSRHDANRDGLLVAAEVPARLKARFHAVCDAQREQAAEDTGSPSEAVLLSAFETSFVPPAAMTELVRDVVAEFSLGFLLGLGLTVFLSGLQLAGQLIDQQLGLQFGSIVNPDLQGGASISSQTFFLLGGVCLLVMQPLNGHLMILSAIFETFEAMPVGSAFLFSDAHVLLTELIQKSLLLAVQVAAPVLATMGLVTISMGFLGHSVPQINQLVVGFPVRSLAGMLILSVSLSGVGRHLVDSVPVVLNDIQMAITSYQ